MTNSVPTSSRAAIVDYTHPIAHFAVSFLIPSSYQSNNLFSATKNVLPASFCTQLIAKLLQTREVFLMRALENDLKSTGKCNLEMGKENYVILHFSCATQKESPYLDPLNKRFETFIY